MNVLVAHHRDVFRRLPSGCWSNTRAALTDVILGLSFVLRVVPITTAGRYGRRRFSLVKRSSKDGNGNRSGQVFVA